MLARCHWFAAITVALVWVGCGRSPVKSGSPHSTVKVSGLLRDLACPVQNPNASATDFNVKCAVDCIRNGSPPIIQTKNTMYLLISTEMPDVSLRERVVPFAGRWVWVSGELSERYGIKAIAVKEIRLAEPGNLPNEPPK